MRNRLITILLGLAVLFITSCDPSKLGKLKTAIADINVSGPLLCELYTTKGPGGRAILALHCVSGGPIVRDFLKQHPIVTAP